MDYKTIIILIFLIGTVNAQYSPCPPLEYQQLQLNEYIDVCVNVKIGEVYEPCLDCICQIRFEDSYGRNVNVPSDILRNENNGYYSFQLSPPYFTASSFYDPNDKTGNYRYWVNCSNDNFEGYDYSTFDIVKDGGLSSNELSIDDIDYTDNIGENDEEYEGIIEKGKKRIYDLLGLNPSDDSIGKADSFLGGTFSGMSELGVMFTGMLGFIKDPAGYITTNGYKLVSETIIQITGAFFLTFFLIECIIAVVSLRDNKNDVFNMMITFARSNIAVIMVIVPLVRMFINITRLLIDSLVSIARLMWELVPFKKFAGF